MDLSGLREAGWRQGDIVPQEISDFLLAEHRLPSGGFLVLVSQSCDLLQPDLEKEPFAEAICGRFQEGLSLRPQNSPRAIVLEILEGETSRRAMFLDRERFRFSREHMLRAAPDLSRRLASPFQLRKLLHMIVKRYRRTAFPDAFNERLRPAWRGKGGIEQRLRAEHHLLSDLLVDLSPSDQELPEGDDYLLGVLMGVMRAEDYDDPEKRAAANSLLRGVAELIASKCNGIDLGSPENPRCEVRSEAILTVAERRDLQRWEWEYLSLTAELEDSLPAPE